MDPLARGLGTARLAAPRNRTLRRLAALVCVADGLVIAAATYLSPRPTDERSVYVAVAALLLVDALVLVTADRIPDRLLAALGIGVPNVAVLGLIGYTTHAESLPILLFWSALASPYFPSRSVAAGNLVVVTLGLAVAAVVSPDEHFSAFSWAVTVLAGGAVSVTVRVIAERADAVISELSETARRDTITGLLNRRGFDERLDEAWTAGDARLSVAFFDLDHFKSVNDLHGHGVGDTVLRLFARVLAEHAREGDVVARTGGEEFGVVMPSREPAAALERCRAVVEAFAAVRIPTDGGVLRCTVSAGIAGRAPRHTSASHLCRDADRALYEAKEMGRDRAVLRQPDRAVLASLDT